MRRVLPGCSTTKAIDEFLEDFPTVSRQQVISFLEEA
jgi:uncharacterized protein (DUF433 family)